ncbi:MAG: pepsin-like aspartyl protease, partial [Acidobacteriota bacterium]
MIAIALVAACGGSDHGAGPDAARGPDAAPDAAPPPGGVTAIALSSPDGTFYTAQTAIGPQSFAMVVDTGSSTAAVAGSSCSGCAVNPRYMPGTSATDMHMAANAQYGSGSWSGEIYKDKLGLGGGTPAVDVALASINSEMTFF